MNRQKHCRNAIERQINQKLLDTPPSSRQIIVLLTELARLARLMVERYW